MDSRHTSSSFNEPKGKEALPDKGLPPFSISKQFELPTSKVSFLTILLYGSSFEIFLQILGAFTALAAGAALPLMTIFLGNFVNLFGGLTSPNTPSLTPPTSTAKFNSEVGSRYGLYRYRRFCVHIYQHRLLGHKWSTYKQEDQRVTPPLKAIGDARSYLRAVLRQNIGFFDYVGAGEISNRLSHDVDLIQDGISDKLSITLASIATFCSGFIIAFIRQWKLALILSCIVPAIVLVFGIGGFLISKFAGKAVLEFSTAATVAEEVISSIRTAQTFGMDDMLSSEYDKNLEKAQRIGYRKVAAGACMFASIFGIVYMAFGLAFWEGSRMIAAGELNIGLLMNVLFAIIVASFSISQILPFIESFSKATAAAQKIFQTIQRVPPIDSFGTTGEILINPVGKIDFENVSFVYPSRPEVLVLNDLSFSIPAGKFTAIVGASGSGKSTIIQLMERFYDPVEGVIRLDGQDIKNLNLHSLRGVVSLVNQEPVLFDTSIYENVCHGMIGTPLEHATEEEKRKEVQKACIMANAVEFIQNLPQAYDTHVGERGVLLSGGQKQRIAIARAIVSDPKILLLDEATSALDTISEQLVQEALQTAAQSRTTVCVAHRMSTIKNADNIIVLSQGKVVEQGAHVELLTRGGIYSDLVQAQILFYHEKEGGKDVDEKTPSLTRSVPDFSGRSITSLVLGEQIPEDKGPLQYSTSQLVKKALEWNKPEYWWLLISWFTTLPAGSVYPAQALLFAYLLNALLNPDLSAMRSRANFLALWWLIIAIVLFLAHGIQQWGFGYASEKMVRRVRYQSLRSIMRQEIAFFDLPEHSTGILTQTLSSEATAMSGLSGTNLGSILTVIVSLTSSIILALAYGWKLALVATSILPVGFAAGYLRVHLLGACDDRLRKAFEKSAALACEQVAAIRTVAALNREMALYQEYRDSLKKPIRQAMHSTLQISALYAFGQSLAFFVNALLYWYGSTLLRTGQYTYIQFIVCFVSLTEGAQGAGHFLSSFAPDITKARAGTANVSRLIERHPSIDCWSKAGTIVETIHGHVEFKDVHFRYPTRPHVPVLRGLDMEVKPGQYVALVGPSGCGKSTIVALLERFYDPIVGTICVDGLPVSEYALSSLRKMIGFVSQEPTLYNGSIRFNLLLGAISAVTQQDLDDACRAANIFDFIQTLPSGYETIVGSKGSQLSGGQKQRIALARALLRKPQILLLDEATSSLDSENEMIVQAALDQAARGRTTIAIAHRLSTVQKADLIFVVEDGRIVERGTHAELLSMRGRYYTLALKQRLESRGVL